MKYDPNNDPANKPYALIDIDGTMYDGYTIDDLVKAQYAESLIPQEYVAQLYQLYTEFKQGTVPYEIVAHKALLVWGEGLKDQTLELIQQHTNNFFDSHNQLFPFAQELVTLLKENGYYVLFVTGEPQFIGSYFTDHLGADGYISSEYELANGTFTGKTTISLGTNDGKKKVLSNLKNELRDSISFGDSEGDIDMLSLTTHAVCVKPREALRKIANEKGWQIVDEESMIPTIKKILS